MAKKGKKGKKGNKGKKGGGPPPPPESTILWRLLGAPPFPLKTPARAGSFVLFVHRHKAPKANRHVPMTIQAGGAGAKAAVPPTEPETVHMLCIAHAETGLHIALPLPPSAASRRAAAAGQFFVRAPGSGWWVSQDNTPVTVEPPQDQRCSCWTRMA